MSTETLTPQNLTWEHIKSWSGPEMKQHMASPLRAAIIELISKRQLAEVEAVAVQQAQPTPTPEETEAEAQRVQAEQARVAEEQRVAAEAAKPKKIVLDYQVKDEKGEPIGRPTHLEASSHEEMVQKIQEAHVQATRAFHRLKQQKVQSLREVSNSPAAPAPVSQMSDADMLAAIKDLKSDDPAKALEAHRKLNKAETDRVQAEADTKLAEAKELARQQQVSYAFLTAHKHDFNNCQANIQKITTYFQDNQLAWTLDNLEIAFHALELELAPVVEPVVPAPPANPTTAAVPAVTTPAAAQVVQPAPAAPVIPTPPANPAPAQPRPGFNGGIVPGQNSAPRPAGSQQGLTMEEIHSWDGPTMRTKMRNPTLRAEIERVVAASQAQKRK